MKTRKASEYQTVQTQLEEDLKGWETNRNNDIVFDADSAKKMKTYMIALEIKSHALLS